MKSALTLLHAIPLLALCGALAYGGDNSGATENMKDGNMKKVSFPNRNISIAGNVYLPDAFDPSQKYPAIIVGHPAGGVKEQTAGLYAKKLAEKGFVTLAFDASYQGESGGEPRGLEDPAVRVEDFRCAADFLSALPYVDSSKIGAMGICGGGGFAISAAITDHRIRAVAGLSAVDLGRLRRRGPERRARRVCPGTPRRGRRTAHKGGQRRRNKVCFLCAEFTRRNSRGRA